MKAHNIYNATVEVIQVILWSRGALHLIGTPSRD